MLTVTHGGATYANATPADLIAAGVPQAAIDAAIAAKAALDGRDAIRRRIALEAGDILSLIGTTADGGQILLYAFATVIRSLHTAQSLAEVRAAAEPFAELANGFLDRLDSGAVRLPFMVKGMDAAVADIETRATAVAKALAGDAA